MSIDRLELRQQVEQLSAANDALKSSNEALSDNIASLSEAANDVCSKCFFYSVMSIVSVHDFDWFLVSFCMHIFYSKIHKLTQVSTNKMCCINVCFTYSLTYSHTICSNGLY